MKNLAIIAMAVAVAIIPSLTEAQTKPTQPPTKPGLVRPGGPMMGGPMGGGDFQKRMAERSKQRRDKLVKDLKLSKDQIKKYDALQKKMGDKRRKSFGQQGQMDMEAMRKKFDAMRTEETNEMKKILTKDQFSKFQKMQAEERKRRGGMMRAPMGGAGRPIPGGNVGRPVPGQKPPKK